VTGLVWWAWPTSFACHRNPRRGQVAALIGLWGIAACAAPRPQLRATELRDPSAVLAAARRREEHFASLRARFTAETTRNGERHSVDGVLVVKKPDKFRLRMMLPFGFTVFDYVSSGVRAQLSLPLQDLTTDGPLRGDAMGFSQLDLEQAFLRGPYAFPGDCSAETDGAGSVIVVCRDSSGDALRQLRIDSSTAAIEDETSYDAGQPRMMIRYDVYRPAGDTSLPYRITLLSPPQHVTLDITVQRYEVNPALADTLFEPVHP
jgi:hypothetical protein